MREGYDQRWGEFWSTVKEEETDELVCPLEACKWVAVLAPAMVGKPYEDL